VVAAFVIFPGSSQDTYQEVSAELDGGTESASELSTASPQTTAAATDAQDSASVEESAGALAPPVADDSDFSVYETDTVALDELLNQADGADSPESVQRQLSNLSFKSLVNLKSNEVNACLNDLDTEIPDGTLEVLVIGADEESGQTIVHVGFDFGEGIEGGMSFVLETCELVEHAPQG
jgi:3-oxoacyl-ACP reductase-like protein